MGILCSNTRKKYYGTPENYGPCWPHNGCSNNGSDSDSDSDSYSEIDISIISKSEESIEVHQSIEIGAMLKYEQIYMKYRSTEIIGSYSYQCCAVSAVAYINAIMQSKIKIRPPPSFRECCTIAYYCGGDIIKSIMMLEKHFMYGITCKIVDTFEILFTDLLPGSFVACFSSLDALLNGALDVDSLQYLKDSNNHLTCIVERYDAKNDCIICRKPWCPSERFQFSHVSVKSCFIIKVHSILDI